MKTKALAVPSILEMTEKRAHRRQIPGHSRSGFAAARSPAQTRPQEGKNDGSHAVVLGNAAIVATTRVPSMESRISAILSSSAR